MAVLIILINVGGARILQFQSDYAANLSLMYIEVIATDSRGVPVYCLNGIVVVELYIIAAGEFGGLRKCI
jgi:hypothetical protein